MSGQEIAGLNEWVQLFSKFVTLSRSQSSTKTVLVERIASDLSELSLQLKC